MNADVSALSRHRLSWEAFASLADGGGDKVVLAQARQWELSWRKSVLRVFSDVLRTRPEASGPIDVEAAWRTIAEAERADPAAVETVIGYPSTGIWASYGLRRLRGVAASAAPLWVDVGHLAALAVAAALRAGTDFALDVPVRHGVLCLPTLGCLLLAGNEAWRVAEVRPAPGRGITVTCDGAEVTVHDLGADGARWLPVRRIDVRSGSLDLRVCIDDLDPFRELRDPRAPARLRAERLDRLTAQLAAAWTLLVEDYSDVAAAMATSLSMLCPLPGAAKFRPLSASSDEAFGGVVLSEPDDPVQLAATLVHEFQHNKMGALQHLTPLIKPGSTGLFYAPWRDDPRPAPGLLQGVYAFTGVTGFWRRRRARGAPEERRLAEFEYALWRAQTLRAVRELAARADTTELGATLLERLASRLAGWLEDPVPADVQRMADLAARDHRSQWQAFHLRPDPEGVRRIAEAWLAGDATLPAESGATRVVVDQSVRGLETRAIVMRCRIAGTPPEAADASDGDIAYVYGRLDDARRAYQRELHRQPGSAGALVGLGLTLSAAGDAAGAVLLRRPELVLAVRRAIEDAGGDADAAGIARRMAD